MAVLWLTQFTIVALYILLRILLVLAKKDFCGSVFETQVGEKIFKKKTKQKKMKKNHSYTLFL